MQTCYFGEQGLTMTSANHIRNLAVQYAESCLSKINSVSFVNKYIQLLGTNEKTPIEFGWGNESNFTNTISHLLEVITQCHSLEAWLNEAVAEKKKMLEKVKSTTLEEYISEELNEMVPVIPQLEPTITEEEYLDTLNIKEQMRYYELQTRAAVIGKYIHADGAFDKAKKALLEVTAKPITTELNGRDTVLFIKEALVSEKVVDDFYYQLQQKHREAQAALNGMKETMRKVIVADCLKKNDAYRKELENYVSIRDKYSAQLTDWKKKKTEEILKLKIVIPYALDSIYQEITHLA